jgi:hypothetical protein
MGLARYALVFGLGFAAGHPTGREKLQAVPGQLKTLAQRPEAQQLRDKGKAAAGQAVQTAKERLGNSSDSAGGTTAKSGDGSAETATRTGWRALGRRRGPVLAEEVVVVTESTPGPRPTATDDPEAAMHGTLPPSGPASR